MSLEEAGEVVRGTIQNWLANDHDLSMPLASKSSSMIGRRE